MSDTADLGLSARLSKLLTAANESRRPIDPVPAEFDALTRDQAFEAQALFSQSFSPVIGWKVGRRDVTAVPGCAPLFVDQTHLSGAHLARDAFRPWQIEAELTLRLGQDLPDIGRPYVRDDMIEAVETVLAAFEILDSRYAAWPKLSAPLMLADLSSHGAMVIGTGAPMPTPAVFDTIPVELKFDGKVVVSHVGGNPAGDPLDLLTWLANERLRKGAPLSKGDLVTTGSCTGMIELPPGARADATFEGIGTVSVTRNA